MGIALPRVSPCPVVSLTGELHPKRDSRSEPQPCRALCPPRDSCCPPQAMAQGPVPPSTGRGLGMSEVSPAQAPCPAARGGVQWDQWPSPCGSHLPTSCAQLCRSWAGPAPPLVGPAELPLGVQRRSRAQLGSPKQAILLQVLHWAQGQALLPAQGLPKPPAQPACHHHPRVGRTEKSFLRGCFSGCPYPAQAAPALPRLPLPCGMEAKRHRHCCYCELYFYRSPRGGSRSVSRQSAGCLQVRSCWQMEGLAGGQTDAHAGAGSRTAQGSRAAAGAPG